MSSQVEVPSIEIIYPFPIHHFSNILYIELSIMINVEISAQCIFSCVLHRVLDTRNFDVSESYYHNRTNRINWYVCEHLTSQICLL